MKGVMHVMLRPPNPDEILFLSKLHLREACHPQELQHLMSLILMSARPLREMYRCSMDLHESLNLLVKLI